MANIKILRLGRYRLLYCLDVSRENIIRNHARAVFILFYRMSVNLRL